jgi:anti-anti-sigma factor
MTAPVQTRPADAFLAGLRITISERGTQTTLALDGEWDLGEEEATRHAIRAALAHQPARLVLDLSGLTFIDSSGVHILMSLFRRAGRLKIEFAIVPGPPAVQRIFDICELTARLPFTNDG